MFRKPTDDSSFSVLPDEIQLEIFDYLNNADLLEMATISQSNYLLARDTYFLREINTYKKRFNQSILWSHLITIASESIEENTRSLTNYMKVMLGELPADFFHPDSLSEFAANANQTKLFGEQFIGVQYLQQQAKWLLDELSKHNSHFDAANIASADAFLDFMNHPEVSHAEKFKLWHCYHELDRLLTLGSLSIKLGVSATISKTACMETLTDPLLSRFVTTRELLAIDSSKFWRNPWLIDWLVKEAIRLYPLQGKPETDQIKLIAIEKLLNCLSDNDLISYFKAGRLGEKKKLFAKIIQSDYPLLTAKLNESSLLDIINFSYNEATDLLDNHPIAVAILKNTSILSNLSHQGLVAILDKLAANHPERIAEYPLLDQFLTPDLLQQWAISDKLRKSDRTIIILTNAKFLSRLNHIEIAILAKTLASYRSNDVLKNKAFLERVQAEPKPNQLLLAMAISNPHGILEKIAENHLLANLLDPEDVMKLCELNSLSAPFFTANKMVTNKLSSTQLLMLFNTGSKAAHIAVESGCFTKLNLLDFTEFLHLNLGYVDFTDLQLDKLLTEVIRRIPLLPSSFPQLPPLVAVLHDKIHYHKELEKHFDALIKDFRRKQIFLEALRQTNMWKAPLPQKPKREIITPETPTLIISQPRPANTTTSWAKIAKIVGLLLLAIAGIALIATGIGSAAGVPMLTSAASLLFGWAALNSAVSAIVTGSVFAGISLLATTTQLMRNKSEKSEAKYLPESKQDKSYSSSHGSLQSKLSHGQKSNIDDSLANKTKETVLSSPSLSPKAAPVTKKEQKPDYIKQVWALHDKQEDGLAAALRALSPNKNEALVKQVFNYVLNNRHRTKKNKFMLRVANTLFHSMNLHENLNKLSEKYLDGHPENPAKLMSLLARHQIDKLYFKLQIFESKKSSTGLQYKNTRDYIVIERLLKPLEDRPLLECLDAVKQFRNRFKDYYESENRQNLSETMQQAFSKVITANDKLFGMLSCLNTPAIRAELVADQLKNQQRERIWQDQQDFMQDVRAGKVTATSENHLRDLYPDSSNEDIAKKLKQLSNFGIQIVKPDQVRLDYAKR